jgi:hypothetical protein
LKVDDCPDDPAEEPAGQGRVDLESSVDGRASDDKSVVQVKAATDADGHPNRADSQAGLDRSRDDR